MIQAKDYEKLSAQTVEIKRMLTVFVQKLTLNADHARQPNRPLWLRPPAALVRISGVWPWVRLHRSLEMLFVVTGGER